MKECVECGLPLPYGQRKYCTRDCSKKVAARREAKRRDDALRAPCVGCGGDKGPCVRGARWCAGCEADGTRAAADTARLAHNASGVKDRKMAARLLSGERVARRRRVDDGFKWCAQCQAQLPLSDFTQTAKKTAAYCKPCTTAYNLDRNLRLRFGMSTADYWALFDLQGGVCWICQRKPRSVRLAVDHDHKTGLVRGLLCSQCNHKLLGAAHDDPERLWRALNYLVNPPAQDMRPGMEVPR